MKRFLSVLVLELSYPFLGTFGDYPFENH